MRTVRRWTSLGLILMLALLVGCADRPTNTDGLSAPSTGSPRPSPPPAVEQNLSVGESNSQKEQSEPADAEPKPPDATAPDASPAGYERVWQADLPEDSEFPQVYVSPEGKRVAAVSTGLKSVRVAVFGDGGRQIADLPLEGGWVEPMPGLETWLQARMGLRALDLTGRMLWETGAPGGNIYVDPTGDRIVVSWDGGEELPAETGMFTAAGELQWRTDQFGGRIWFTDGDRFLVTSPLNYEWQIVTAAGEVEQEGQGFVATISRDGQCLAYEDGRLEALDGLQILEGQMRRLVATNRSNLYVIADLTENQLLGYRPTGELLWQIPDRSMGGGVSDDGSVVWVSRAEALSVYAGTSGELLLQVPEAHGAAVTADGRFIAVAFQRAVALHALKQGGQHMP